MLKPTLALLAFVVAFVLQRRKLRRYQFLDGIGDIRTIDEIAVSFKTWVSLKRMIGIAVPSVMSREGMGTTAFIALFCVKALLGVQRSNADGAVVEAFLGGGGKKKTDALLHLAGIALLNAACSGTIEHMRYYLIAVYRQRLTLYFHRRFFDQNTFYYAASLDDRIDDADTHITNYCEEFAEHFAELPYYFLLPAFEALSSLYVVFREVGRGRAAALSSVVMLTLGLMQHLTPPFGKIHAALLSREEDFRRLHTEIKSNAEQLAMHQGGNFMRNRLDVAFYRVRDVMKHMALARGNFQMMELGVATCAWDVAGLIACGGSLVSKSSLSRFVVQRRVISDFNTSMKALVVNMKELSHLSEFSEKLAAFDVVLDSLSRGEFEKKPDPRFSVASSPSGTLSRNPSFLESPTLHKKTGQWSANTSPMTLQTGHGQGSTDTTPSSKNPADFPVEGFPTSPLKLPMAVIEFADLNVSTPNGVVLVAGLNLTIRLEESWAIVGPNGCGKSSILRTLAKLWIPSHGRMTIHPIVDLFFLPQQAFMVQGCTFVEQIVFPDVLDPEAPTPQVEKRAQDALALATGASIVEEVFGDWENPVVASDRSFDWSSLSGGQQQKVALARLFFHAQRSLEAGRVAVAVMDESTSQMDSEAEKELFHNLADKKVQMISSSHRREVTAHHHAVLTMSRHAAKWSVKHQTPS